MDDLYVRRDDSVRRDGQGIQGQGHGHLRSGAYRFDDGLLQDRAAPDRHIRRRNDLRRQGREEGRQHRDRVAGRRREGRVVPSGGQDRGSITRQDLRQTPHGELCRRDGVHERHIGRQGDRYGQRGPHDHGDDQGHGQHGLSGERGDRRYRLYERQGFQTGCLCALLAQIHEDAADAGCARRC